MFSLRNAAMLMVLVVVGCTGADGMDGADGSDGTDGHELLVTTAVEPPGANCSAGGTRIDAGLDLDDDGVLDAGEITETVYVCDGEDGGGGGFGTVLEGSYTIENSLDVALLAGVETITGNLTVSAPGMTGLTLPDLVEVGGSIRFYVVDPFLGGVGNPDLVSIAMPALTTVGGDFDVQFSPEVASLDASVLATVGGSMNLSDVKLVNLDGVAALTSAGTFAVNGALLIDVDGLAGLSATSFSVSGAALADLSGLSGLTDVPGSLGVYAGAVTDFSALAGLSTVGGSLNLGGGAVTAIALPALVSAGGIGLIGIPVVTVDLPALQSVGISGLFFGYLPNLVRLDLPALESVDSYIQVTNNDVLAWFTAPLLVDSGNGFAIIANPVLPICHAEDIRQQLLDNGWSGQINISGGLPCRTIDWCRLQFPLDATVNASATVDFYGRLYIAGLTDATAGIDGAPVLRAAVGVGADGTDPSTDASWAWTAAAGTPGWNGSTAGEPNNDEYTAARVAGATGAYDFAFRFSGDGGRTWTYCDRAAGAGADGSENGYQIANAGHLTVN